MVKRFLVILFVIGLGNGFASEVNLLKVTHEDNQWENDFFIQISSNEINEYYSISKLEYNQLYTMKSIDSLSVFKTLFEQAEFEKISTKTACTRGVGLCGAGAIYVLIAGKSSSRYSTPNGPTAQVGTRYVDGAESCVVGALWITGCSYGIYGIGKTLAKNGRKGKHGEYKYENDEYDSSSIDSFEKYGYAILESKTLSIN